MTKMLIKYWCGMFETERASLVTSKTLSDWNILDLCPKALAPSSLYVTQPMSMVQVVAIEEWSNH